MVRMLLRIIAGTLDIDSYGLESALELFPRYGIRELDAVILTHGHADACYGMDALRQWTLGGAVQKHIDIYLSSETMDTIQTTFPFLVDVRNATGNKKSWDNGRLSRH